MILWVNLHFGYTTNSLKKILAMSKGFLVTAYFNHSHKKKELFKVLSTGQLQHMFAK
jgi:hypothetical protein